MNRLSTEQVITVHSQLIEATGGTDGIRDMGLLESALNSPFQTFEGADLYPSLIQKATRLCYSLIANHPFIDGNKRTGIHVMLIFFTLNGIEVKLSQSELIEIGLGIAAGYIDTEQLLKKIYLNI